MAVLAVRFFSLQAEEAAAVNTLTASTLPGTNPTTGNFADVLGQALAALGPSALDTTLATIGTGNTNNGVLGGLTNTLFTLLLLNNVGNGQNVASQPALQQLLVTQLLASSTDSTDSSGLGAVGTQDLTAALAQQQGANSTLLSQLAIASLQPNPILFSASALAQAFQIGNGTGLPA
jgi:hypothetical protein